MSVSYDPIHWTAHKRLYDRIMFGFIGVYFLLFIGLMITIHPTATIETIIIRATGTLAFLMLHVILIIGPLCRLDSRFLPLLYNRRHFGVATFVVSAIHGIFNLVQFHALGNVNPFVSLLTSGSEIGGILGFPFQVLGLAALFILFLMAATSHDFWLNILTPPVWKSLHMSVYLVYAMLVMHVMLGVIQLEKSSVLIGLTAVGLVTIIGFHLASARKQWYTDRAAFRDAGEHTDHLFVYACELDAIPEKCAKMLIIDGQNIAIFKYDGKVSAVHNLCKHQNGPLSEGKIIDGCITCPWHGYQYRPEDGQSPPPFKEKLATYDVRLEATSVFINPKPYPEGTNCTPAQIL